jgi:hypothetical protein
MTHLFTNTQRCAGAHRERGSSTEMYVCIWMWTHHASIYNNAHNAAQVLIESGAASIEAQDLWGETALLKAARQGRKKVVQVDTWFKNYTSKLCVVDFRRCESMTCMCAYSAALWPCRERWHCHCGGNKHVRRCCYATVLRHAYVCVCVCVCVCVAFCMVFAIGA